MANKKFEQFMPCVCTLLVSFEDDQKDVLEFIQTVKHHFPDKVVEVNEENEYEVVKKEAHKWEEINENVGEFRHPYILVLSESGPRSCIEDSLIEDFHFEVARINIIQDDSEREEYVDQLSELFYLNCVHFRENGETVEEFAKRLFQ